jgi:hypothetical protein
MESPLDFQKCNDENKQYREEQSNLNLLELMRDNSKNMSPSLSQGLDKLITQERNRLTEDKFDELLLDLERADRATDRGSHHIARQWMQEAREDLRDLRRNLLPELSFSTDDDQDKHRESEEDEETVCVSRERRYRDGRTESETHCIDNHGRRFGGGGGSGPAPAESSGAGGDSGAASCGTGDGAGASCGDGSGGDGSSGGSGGGDGGCGDGGGGGCGDGGCGGDGGSGEYYGVGGPSDNYSDSKYETTDNTSVSDSSQPDRSKPTRGTVEQVLQQNNRNANQVFPGENTDHFGWFGGKAGAGVDKPTVPDDKYNYMMAWNMVYPEKGKEADPNARVEMTNFRSFAHTTDGRWVELQNQNQSGIGGGLSYADFRDMYAVFDRPITNENGIASFQSPPEGYNFQPWIGSRGDFSNLNIDGIFISGSVRADRPNSNLVIDQGADWYAHGSGTAVGLENSDGIGTSNWMRLSENWQPLFYTTVSEEELRRNPPPGIG